MVGAGHAQSHRDEPPTFAQGPNAHEPAHRTPEVHVYLPGEWLAEWMLPHLTTTPSVPAAEGPAGRHSGPR